MYSFSGEALRRCFFIGSPSRLMILGSWICTLNRQLFLEAIGLCYFIQTVLFETPCAHPAILHCLPCQKHTHIFFCGQPRNWEILWALQCCSEDCYSSLLWCVAVSLHKVACCLHCACQLQLHGASLGCISQQAVSLHLLYSIDMC